jgi:hypothetical protein
MHLTQIPSSCSFPKLGLTLHKFANVERGCRTPEDPCILDSPTDKHSESGLGLPVRDVGTRHVGPPNLHVVIGCPKVHDEIPHTEPNLDHPPNAQGEAAFVE